MERQFLLRNLNVSWQIEIDNSVAKFLKRIPQKDADRLSDVLTEFESSPFAGDIIKLSGEENSWRRRVGSYRIFYKVYSEQSVILIQELQRRGSKTY